jgi:PIF1-like helicase
LRKLEAFHRIYMELFKAGKVAPRGSHWARDCQPAYSMFLTARHNGDVLKDRTDNNGVLVARYEQADELDDAEYPSAMSFLPADVFAEILRQEPPTLKELSVAFPLNVSWQEREEMVSCGKSSLFMADPPMPAVEEKCLSFWHRKAVELVKEGREQIIYIYGKAGTGKTLAALWICQHFKGRVQAGAGTGKAAANFNGPTMLAMFGWSHNEYRVARAGGNQQRKMNELACFQKKTDVFVIDECNAISAAQFGLLEETMCKVFDPEGKTKKRFGGKTMVFLGDGAQLRPVAGAAIYDSGMVQGSRIGRSNFFSSQNLTRTLRGQAIYRDYLVPKCIMLTRGFRNRGLLQEIADRLRDGKQTDDDLDRLLFQRAKYPLASSDYGVHYTNEACQAYNCRDLWSSCSLRARILRLD